MGGAFSRARLAGTLALQMGSAFSRARLAGTLALQAAFVFLMAGGGADALAQSPARAPAPRGERSNGGGMRSSPIAQMTKSFGSGSGKTEVMSDSAEYELDSGWVTFSGNVAIRYQDTELRADRIRYNQKTGEAVADGNVAMTGNDGSLLWRGDHIVVDTNRQEAEAKGIDIYSAPFRILADGGNVSTEKDKSGADAKVYEIDHAVVTTCTNAPGHFHYQFGTSRLRVRPDRDLAAWGATPSLFGVPFFWFPYYWRDLNHHYGFRFEPGYQSSWGAYLLSSYQFPIYRDVESGAFLDSKTSADYRYKRGWAYGERLRWGRGEESKGWFSAYYLEDEKLPITVADPERYRIRLNQSWNITPADKLLIQGLYVSDDRFMENFFEEEYREMGQPDNHIAYTHYANDYSYGLLGRARLNEFYTQVERLPEAWFNLNSMELGGSGIYVENSSSAAYLRRKFDERYDPTPEPYDAFRADSATRLSMPLKFGGFLNVVPRAGYRATYYSKTLEEIISSNIEHIVATNEYGDVESFTRASDTKEIREAGGGMRSVVELGTEVSFKAYGFWEDTPGNIWRHVIEPYADYTFIPEPNLVPAQLRQFDDIDAIDKRNAVRLGLRNRWQVKPVGGADIYERIYNNIYTDVNLDPATGEKSVSSFYTETRFNPNSWLSAKFDTRYNFDESALDQAALRVTAWHQIFDADVEYRYRADDSSLFLASLTWHINNNWSVNGSGRYEFETSKVEEIGSWLEWRLDCIAFRLYASVKPDFDTSEDGSLKDDYRISLLFWLTDFVPDHIRERDSR